MASYYDLLGVSKSAGPEEIRKAYRSKALTVHPDKNRSHKATEEFKQLTLAYQTLSDPQKKSSYDKKHGFSNDFRTLQEISERVSQISEELMSDANFRVRQGRGYSDVSPKVFQETFQERFQEGFQERLQQRLQERYPQSYSALSSINNMGSNLGGAAQNTGPDNGDYSVASNAAASGKNPASGKINDTSVSLGYPNNLIRGPNINYKLDCTLEELYSGKKTRLVLTRNTACAACNATGMNCLACNGAKYVRNKNILSIDIPPGSKHKDSIVFKNQADSFVNGVVEPGNIIIEVNQIDHDVFTRKNDDLVMIRKISLMDSLCGGTFSFSFLNKEVLGCSFSKIIKPGQMKVVPSYGMPKTGTGEFGDLFIQFEVQFPDPNDLSPDYKDHLKKVFKEVKAEDEIKVNVELKDIDENRFNQYREKGLKRQKI